MSDSWENQANNNQLISGFADLDLDAPPFECNFVPEPVAFPPAPPAVELVKNEPAVVAPPPPVAEPKPVAPPVPVEYKKIDLSKRKETVNLVFIGHVDAGKSTIGGHLLHLTGMVDERTLEKYQKEAKDKGRETWYLSWALDTNVEERNKGKTVECGRGFFVTEKKQFVIVDAPGHKSFVPNMIGGAAVADVAILVISARRGEFETGFEKGGQTREHALLVKTIGVKQLVVLINKMDDPTVNWDKERYDECVGKLLPYLKKLGFNPKVDLHFMPCSGYTGAYLLKPPADGTCLFYNGPSLLDYLDNLPPMSRKLEAPFRMPISEKFKDMGTIVGGKIESGCVFKNQALILMPNKVAVEVTQILENDEEVDETGAGALCKLKLKNIEEEDVSYGFTLCSPDNLCHVASKFDAQVIIQDYKSIICPGFTTMLHIHSCCEEVQVKMIICTIDRKTNEKKEIKPRFIKQDDIAILRFEVLNGSICLEKFADYPQMGRFILREEGHTIGIGKIVKIVSAGNGSATQSNQPQLSAVA